MRTTRESGGGAGITPGKAEADIQVAGPELLGLTPTVGLLASAHTTAPHAMEDFGISAWILHSGFSGNVDSCTEKETAIHREK